MILSSVPPPAWLAFHLAVFALIAVDLSGGKGGQKTPSVSSALRWTGVWIAVSLAFCGAIRGQLGAGKAGEWLSAYVLEYALSVDNIFVFLVVFRFFSVPQGLQHKTLFWGVVGAFILRATMIFAGAALVKQFAWLEAVFGAFLLYTAWKLAFGTENQVEPGNNRALALLRRIVPVAKDYDGAKFWTLENGRRAATPLLAVLIVIETTDLLFALDSIPATLSVVKSRETFVAYTANICAILGLRSLFFVVAGLMGLFRFLPIGLSLVLAFVGGKMLAGFALGWQVPTFASLGVIALILAGAVLLSILRPTPPEGVS